MNNFKHFSEIIQDRCTEHFGGVPRWLTSIKDKVINKIPHVDCNIRLHGIQSLEETIRVTFLLSFGKYQHQFFQISSNQEVFYDESNIEIYKQKVNHEIRNNDMGISLLSIAGSILARDLWNHYRTRNGEALTVNPEFYQKRQRNN